jgi:hypothetical protein
MLIVDASDYLELSTTEELGIRPNMSSYEIETVAEEILQEGDEYAKSQGQLGIEIQGLYDYLRELSRQLVATAEEA